MPLPKIIGPDGREIKRDKYTASKLKKLEARYGSKWDPLRLNNIKQREEHLALMEALKESQEARLAHMRGGRRPVVGEEAIVRKNRHRKRYEEERQRAEGLVARRRWEDEDGGSGSEHEWGKEDDWEEDGSDDEEGRAIEHLVKVRVVKAKQRDQKQFEMLDPVRNVVALDEDDFGEPSSRAPLPLDLDEHSDLDEWEEVDSSDADDSDDAFREKKDDIELDVPREPSYARVVASTPSERQAWLVESL